MKFLNHKIYRNKFLYILTFFALLLRILNPTYGNPILYILGDEVSNYLSAWSMLAEKTLINHSSPYPPFGSYIQIPFFIASFVLMRILGIVQNLYEFQHFLVINEGFFLFIPRILAGIFGAGTVPVIYLLGREIFPDDKKIARWSSILMAFSFIHIQTSHFARPWPIAIFFATLSALFTIRSIRPVKNKRKNLILAIIVTIITAGFLQSWVYALFLFLLIRMYAFFFEGRNTKELSLTIVGFLCVIASAFLFMHITEYKINIEAARNNFDWGIRGTLPIFSFIQAPASSQLIPTIIATLQQSLIPYNLLQIVMQEPIFLIALFIGLLQRKTWKSIMLIFTVYALCLFLAISTLLDYQIRHLLPMWIGSIIIAGIGLATIEEYLRNSFSRIIFYIIVLTSLVILPLRWNYLYVQEPTFEQARMWISQNIMSGQKLACRGVRFCIFTPSREAVDAMRKSNPQAYGQAAKILPADTQDMQLRPLVIVDKFAGSTYQEKFDEAYAQYPFEYIIDYYWDPKNSLRNELNDKNMQLVSHFSPLKSNKKYAITNMTSTMDLPTMYHLFFTIERSGPYMDILKLDK